MNPEEMRRIIESAFENVTLGGGISIRQGEVCDNYGTDNEGRELSDAEFDAVPHGEITDDWTAIPLTELEAYPYLAYLDAKGFRYYIPAFLLSLLEDPQSASMRVISTLSAVHPERDCWLYRMNQYELLNQVQRSAIATFLFHLQDYSLLDTSDQREVSASLQAYWHQYLISST